MPTPPPRPATDDSTHIPLCDIPLRDVIGRSAHLVYVRFERGHQLIALRPHLVRVLDAPGGYFDVPCGH
jgi:hypothetical protein